MTEPPKSPSVPDLERRMLRLLCQDPGARDRLLHPLRKYRWHDLVHRVIFEIIAAARRLSIENLRSQLPIRLTRAGFPDFPCDELFQPHSLSAHEAETLMRELGAPGK